MSEQRDKNNEIKMLKSEPDQINLSDYPLDSFLIRSDHRSIWEVMQRIKSKRYLLERDFPQDDCRQSLLWDEVKQSKLVESVLMRIPLPPFYLAEQLDGTIVVVDGLQRLKTLYHYLNNEFSLKGLSQQLNGKTFKELPPKLKRRLEDTNLILFLIDSKVEAKANAGIFERLNSHVSFSNS